MLYNMKKYIFILFVILATSCGKSISDLEPPIILAAESKEGDILLIDNNGDYIELKFDNIVARSIRDSYQPGDTLPYNKFNGK